MRLRKFGEFIQSRKPFPCNELRDSSENHKGGLARASIIAAVSYPGVGRFRRAETGILGVEQIGGPTGPPFILPVRFS